MDVKKVGIAVGVVFVLFFVISQPDTSAALVRGVVGALGSAAGSVVLFVRRLVG